MRERYRIEAELGHGGMGVVYAAVDHVRGHEVALKRLKLPAHLPATDASRITSLFEREYYTLHELAHPHVVSVFDYGVDAHGPYYTMERLHGESLRACAPVPWVEAARIARDVASALALLHSRRMVHRDVTPLNIIRGIDGSVKLIDFGAMIPAGVAKQVVGTPAYVAPECVHLQPLDGRVDLFALGACLYFALSGRNAFPVHRLKELPNAWQHNPVSLRQYGVDAPEALVGLIVELLCRDQLGRPRTAAEVFERLTVIASLPRTEHVQVAHSYLTQPALVGRDNLVSQLRTRASRARAGRGAALSIEGEPGIGRSRLLDAAVLEARLSGLQVARADASDAQTGQLGILSALLLGLMQTGVELKPVLQRRELSQILDSDRSALMAEAVRERSLRELSELLLELASHTPLALAVDDLHLADEASLSVIASVALQLRNHALLLVVTQLQQVAARESQAHTLLRSVAKPLPVPALDAAQSRSLLSSLFGEVPNLDMLNGLLHGSCAGSPRLLIEAAQALIFAKLIRYEGATWNLRVDPDAVAQTLARKAGGSRLADGLSDDALDLLQVLSLDRDNVMTLADYAALTEHGDQARMHRALLELTRTDWLITASDRTRFRRDDLRHNLAQQIPEARAQAMHARLAKRCREHPELAPVYETHHLLHAGQAKLAHRPMEAMTVYVEQHPRADVVRYPIALETLEAFCELPDAPGVHPGARANYAASTVVNAVYQGLPERAVPKIAQALEGMARFAGVYDYAELADLPEPERLTQALTRADARCREPGIGGLDLTGTLRRYTQLCLTTGVCANFMADPELLRALPDLSAFTVLSPALGLAMQLLDGLCMLARGQAWHAWDVFADVTARVSALPPEAIDGLTAIALKGTSLGYLCMLDAEHACHSTPTRLADYASFQPQNAASARARYHTARGEYELARAARKASELLSLRAGSLPETRNTEAMGYLTLHALADDLLGLRQTLTVIDEVARRRPSWSARAALARAHVLRCERNYEPALELIEQALVGLPSAHMDFVGCSAARLDLLNASGRYAQALREGETHLASATKVQAPTFRIELCLSRSHAELGQHVQAETRFAEAHRALMQRSCEGVLLGNALEVGARVALCRGDTHTFVDRAEACREHYGLQEHSARAARFAQLMRDAARAGVGGDELGPLSEAFAWVQEPDVPEQQEPTLSSDAEFYSLALGQLVEGAAAGGGCLYTTGESGLKRVACSAHLPDALVDALDRRAQLHYERALLTAQGDQGDCSASAEPRREREPTGEDGDGSVHVWTLSSAASANIDGVAALVTDAHGTIGAPPQPVIEQLATELAVRADQTQSVA